MWLFNLRENDFCKGHELVDCLPTLTRRCISILLPA